MKVKDMPLTGQYSEDKDIPSMDDWKHSRDVDSFYSELEENGFSDEQEALKAELGLTDEELEEYLNEGGFDLDEGEEEAEEGEEGEEGEEEGEEGEDEEGEERTSFKPINFSTEIDGKPYNFNINSKEDLNVVLDKAALSEDLWEKQKDLQIEMEEMKELYEFGKQHMERLESDPMGMATNVLNERLFRSDDGPQQIMEWAASIYHSAKEYNQNPREYYQHKAMHQRKGEEDPVIKEQKEQIQREREELAVKHETYKLDQWRTTAKTKYSEVGNAIGKLSGDPQWLDSVLQMVMQTGRSHVKEGKKFDARDLEQQLQKLIRPMYNFYNNTSKKPSKAPNKKNKSATKNLRKQKKTGKRGSGDSFEKMLAIAESVYS